MSNHINRSYLPTVETEAYLWLTNLAEQLPGVVADALGITTTQTNALLKALQLLTDTHRSGRCDQAIKDLLRLNPLGKKPVPADAKPQYTALIEDNQLTVRFTKARYHYFLVRIDHGTGDFDHEYPALESPFKDATPLPADAPQIWRVQLLGFVKGQTVGIPGDIIDVAAKTYTAEHSEGAN
jgi:hypothetical protein